MFGQLEMKISVCEKPIFVVGAPRSGTSMLQWALRQHPDLWGGEESDFLEPLIAGLHKAYDFGCLREDFHWLSSEKVSRQEFLQHIGYGVNSLYMSRSGGRRWVETTPRYTLMMPDLSEMFPDAIFLLMMRDGRQVVDSLRNFVNPYRHAQACKTWREHTVAGLRFAALSDEKRVRQVMFDNIVTDTDAEMRRIHEFLELEYEPASAEFIANKPPINSSFPGEPSALKLAPRWLAWGPKERRTFQSIAGSLLIELGFESDDSWLTRSS